MQEIILKENMKCPHCKKNYNVDDKVLTDFGKMPYCSFCNFRLIQSKGSNFEREE